ncbi:MAG: hypothetical protein ACRCX2_32210, partial [Paraclostridium sp.]
MAKLKILKNEGVEFSLSGKNYNEAEYQIEIKKHNRVHYYDLIPEEEVYTIHESDLRMDVENKKYIVREAQPPFNIHVVFPDENLRTHIITRCSEEFGIGEEKITKEHLAQLKWIGSDPNQYNLSDSALNTDITTWEGLQYLTGLEYMTLYKNKNITSLRDLVIPASVTSVRRAFTYCSNLTTLSPNLFKKAVNVTNADEVFSYTAIENVPSGLFTNLPVLTSAYDAFSGNIHLKSVAEPIFINCPSLTNITRLFAYTGISSISKDAFQGCESITNANYIFQGCKYLYNIPSGLFDSFVNLETLDGGFLGCVVLENVGQGLLSNCTKLRSMRETFSSCYSLNIISPTDELELMLIQSDTPWENAIDVTEMFTSVSVTTNVTLNTLLTDIFGGKSFNNSTFINHKSYDINTAFVDTNLRDHV